MTNEKFSSWQYYLAPLLPATVLVTFLVLHAGKLQEEIRITAQEVLGLNIIHDLFQLTLTAQQIRGLRQFQYAGIDAHDAALADNRKQFTIQSRALGEKMRTVDLSLAQQLQEILQGVQQLDQPLARPDRQADALQRFHLDSKQIDGLIELASNVGSLSNLTLDPDLDAYYLVDITVKHIPRLVEHLGRLRGLTINVLLNKKTSRQSVLDSYYHTKAIQNEMQKLLTGYYNPARVRLVRRRLQPELDKLKTAFQAHLRQLPNLETIHNPVQNIDNLFSQGTRLIDISKEIHLRLTGAINEMLLDRLESLHQQRNHTILGGLVGLIFMFCFAAYFYRGNKLASQSVMQARFESKDYETRHQAILDKMLDGVITINEKGIIYSINPAVERIFGYTEEELLGRNIKMLMPPEYSKEHDSHLENYHTTGQMRIIGIDRRVEGLRKDGSTFPLDLAVSEIQFQGQRMFSGIVRDISERIEAEKTIQAGASRLQTVLDNAVDGILTVSAHGIIQSFNPAAEKIFGYSAKEVLGNNVKLLMPSPHREEHDTYMQNYLKTGKAHIIGIGREVEGMRKDGSVFPMDLAVSEMRIDGEPVYCGIVRDITERKQMEKMKNEFISTVSHELRTPLTSIRGSLGLVMAETLGKLPGPVKDLLTITSNNTERLLLLINDILDIQKIESGKMAFRFQNLELQAFLQKAIQANRSYAEQYGVGFALKPGHEKVRVYADKDRLMQAVSNLMSNAAKFSPRGDTIELHVARHEGVIRISVSDHGPGIPEEFRDKLFEKFTQYDSTDTRQNGGTGLGLSITRLIVEKHGGRIDYISQQHIGTTFYIELPELVSDVENGKPPAELSGKHVPRVLIVEDDPDVAALLQRLLAEAGFNSDVAHTAAGTRQLLRENPGHYQAMTLDIMLPDDDGINLLTFIRKKAETCDLPVIVVSARADDTKRKLNGGALGIVDWINKPIDQERLKHVVMHASGPKPLPRILHVEDDQDIHRIVSRMLQNDCELVWTATVSAAREILEQEIFDLVLLDINLPDGSGLDLFETIERRVNPPRVIIFSAQNVDPEIASQVNGVLIKSHTTNEELLRTITGNIEDF